MNVRGVQRGPAPSPTRATIDAAPGFGDAMDTLLRATRPAAGAPTAGPTTGPTTAGIQFSRHANARMESRGIALDEHDLTDLSHAVDTLARRGAKESLLLLEDHAFIVGVPERKVITAMTRREAVGTVFTQIDSTVVVR